MPTTLGLIEKVKINGKEVLAKIDTGADHCSLDKALAKELDLNNFIKKTSIKSTHGKSIRPVIEAELEIKDRKIKTQFNLADRSHMKYPILIGKDILKQDFIIDPSK